MSEENIMSMTDESFQDHCGNMTAEEARIAAKTFTSAAANDPNHPYVSTVDPTLHKQAVARASRLFEQSHAEDPDLNVYDANGEQMQGQTSTEYLRLLDEAKIEQAEKQSKLVKEAVEEMEQLVAMGYDRAEIPDDISPATAELLRAQRLNATGSKESLVLLTDILNRQARELRAEPELTEAIASLNKARAVLGEMVPDEFKTITDSVLAIVNKARKAQHG